MVDWKNFYRDIACEYYIDQPVLLGVGGTDIDIDETVISRRKYNRGRLVVDQQWFFGGIERQSSRCFIVPVQNRSAATLLPIIEHHVAPCNI